jgi:hypothetical protein
MKNFKKSKSSQSRYKISLSLSLFCCANEYLLHAPISRRAKKKKKKKTDRDAKERVIQEEFPFILTTFQEANPSFKLEKKFSLSVVPFSLSLSLFFLDDDERFFRGERRAAEKRDAELFVSLVLREIVDVQR